ncbi:MAG: hypothetical protein ABDH28_03400 [Brevinematia bacterium]
MRVKGKHILGILMLYIVNLALFPSYAQKSSSVSQKDKMIVSGDEGFFKRGYTRFTGNAYVEKGNIRMSAEVIEYFETNNLAIGRSNVVLRDLKSGLIVKGGYSEYYGDSNFVIFFKNPHLTLPRENIFLRGDVLILDQDEESVISKTNSYLSNNSVEIFSDVIKIFSRSNVIKLSGSSRVVSSNFNIRSDSAIIFTVSNRISGGIEIKRYIGLGNVYITGTNFTLSSERIAINFTNNQVQDYIATCGVKISNEGSIITSEYFRSEFEAGRDTLHIAMTNVCISNFSNNEVIFSDYLLSDRKNNYELMVGDVMYVANRGQVKIMAKIVERFLSEGVALLRKDVVLETESINIISEMAKYDERSKLMYMVGSPRIINEDRLGVSANIVTVDVEKKRAKIEDGDYGYVIPRM